MYTTRNMVWDYEKCHNTLWIKKKTSDDTNKTCHKAFYNATQGGTFLGQWYDPLRVHCYGFHVITSSEGRKYPFPHLIYSWKLLPHKYVMVLAAGLRNIVVDFIMIFCMDSLKCPYVYMSKRIPALDIGINSEICEQFNASSQKHKYNARSMNQSSM